MSKENAKRFLDELDQNEKALEMLKEMKDADSEEEIRLFASAARETGYDTTDEEIREIMENAKAMQIHESDEAAELVKKLSREDVDGVAGGKERPACKDTYKLGENCWWNDQCNKVINSYVTTHTDENGNVTKTCAGQAYCEKIMKSPECGIGRLIHHI